LGLAVTGSADGSGAPGPDRPTICTPPALQRRDDLAAQDARAARQPALGLAGLLLVVPIAGLLAFGAGGPETSVQILAPIVTCALPLILLVTFWWEDWPGTAIRPAAWSGWVDTLFVAVAAIGFTVFAQMVVGGADVRGVFEATPGPGHAATFPAVLPLAGAAFTAMLELTLVSEGWPLRSLRPKLGGLAAVALSWAIAIALYLAVVDTHPPAGSGLRSRDGTLSGAELGALLVVVGVWQVWWYIGWNGWPFSALAGRAKRLTLANAVVLGGGISTYVVVREVGGVELETITAVAGSAIAAGLVVSVLFEGMFRLRLTPEWDRILSVAFMVVLTTALYFGLSWSADRLTWTRVTSEEWVAYAALDAVSVSVILHTAIGHRWPFGDETLPRGEG
jgi:hypothetical protein